MNLWTWATRSRAGIATMAIGVLAAAGLATAVPVLTVNGSDQRPASDEQVYVPPALDAPAAVTDTPAPAATTPQPVAPVTAAAPTATVDAVTEPAPQQPAAPETTPAPEPAPATYDPAAPWTDSTGRTYVPAVPVPMEPLPGEANYVPPAN